MNHRTFTDSSVRPARARPETRTPLRNRTLTLLALGLAFAGGLAAGCGAGVDNNSDGTDTSDSSDTSDRPDAAIEGPQDAGDTAPTIDAEIPDAEPVRSTVFAITGSATGAGNGANASIELRNLTIADGHDQTAARLDPVMRRLGDKFYILNRGSNPDIVVVDENRYLLTRYSSPLAANPQDIAIVGTKMYIPSLGGVGVAVVGGGDSGHAIDLSDLDVDGHPDCMSIYKVDNKLFIACAMLDQTGAPRGPGKVVVLDATTEVRTATLTLSTARPYSLFEQLPNGDLVIATVPSFTSSTTGCIERITTGGIPSATGCMISNVSLGGGYATTLAVQSSPPTLYMTVNFFPAWTLRAFDLTAAQLRADPLTPASQRVSDVVACPDGEVVFADIATGTGGLRVLDRDGTERTTAPISLAKKPTSIHGLACY